MNVYQWLVLAGLFVFAVNEVRLEKLNNLDNYSAFRIMALILSYIYLSAIVISSSIFLFLKLGTL